MAFKPNRGAFVRVRERIGSSEIWRGRCTVGNGSLLELVDDLRGLIQAHDVPLRAPMSIGWDEFPDSLSSIRQTLSCQGCHRAGDATAASSGSARVRMVRSTAPSVCP